MIAENTQGTLYNSRSYRKHDGCKHHGPCLIFASWAGGRDAPAGGEGIGEMRWLATPCLVGIIKVR